MDELLDVLDASGARTGRVVPKDEAHRRGLWHRCAHCWVLSLGATGGGDAGPRLLLQRRAAVKETWPDRIDATAAGHLMAGEEALEGCLRELGEELGLAAEPGDLVPIGVRGVDLAIPAGLDREHQHHFLLVSPLALEDLRLQEEEVAAVLSLPLGDVEDLCGGATVRAGREERPVSRADFVPGTCDHLLRVVIPAARELLGDRGLTP